MIFYITHSHDFSLRYLHYWRWYTSLDNVVDSAPNGIWPHYLILSFYLHQFLSFSHTLSPHCLLKYCLLLIITKTLSMVTVFPLMLVSFSNIIWWNQLHRSNFYFSCYFLLSNAATIKKFSQTIHCHLSPQLCIACRPYRSVYPQ